MAPREDSEYRAEILGHIDSQRQGLHQAERRNDRQQDVQRVQRPVADSSSSCFRRSLTQSHPLALLPRLDHPDVIRALHNKLKFLQAAASSGTRPPAQRPSPSPTQMRGMGEASPPPPPPHGDHALSSPQRATSDKRTHMGDATSNNNLEEGLNLHPYQHPIDSPLRRVQAGWGGIGYLDPIARKCGEFQSKWMAHLVGLHHQGGSDGGAQRGFLGAMAQEGQQYGASLDLRRSLPARLSDNPPWQQQRLDPLLRFSVDPLLRFSVDDSLTGSGHPYREKASHQSVGGAPYSLPLPSPQQWSSAVSRDLLEPLFQEVSERGQYIDVSVNILKTTNDVFLRGCVFRERFRGEVRAQTGMCEGVLHSSHSSHDNHMTHMMMTLLQVHVPSVHPAPGPWFTNDASQRCVCIDLRLYLHQFICVASASAPCL